MEYLLDIDEVVGFRRLISISQYAIFTSEEQQNQEQSQGCHI